MPGFAQKVVCMTCGAWSADQGVLFPLGAPEQAVLPISYCSCSLFALVTISLTSKW